MSLEGLREDVGHGNDAAAEALGLGLELAPHGAAHVHKAPLEVHVREAERDDLATPEPGVPREEDEQVHAGVDLRGRLDESLVRRELVPAGNVVADLEQPNAARHLVDDVPLIVGELLSWPGPRRARVRGSGS